MNENTNASDTGSVVEPGVAQVSDRPVAAAPAEHASQSEKKPAAASPPPIKKQDKPRSGSVFGVLLNLLLLIAVFAVGYGYWQQKRMLDSLGAQYAELAGQVGNSSGQFTSLQDSQQRIDDSLQEMDGRLQEMQQQLQQSVAQQEQSQQQAQQQLATQLGENNTRIASLAAQLNAVNAEVASTRQQVGQIGNPTADAVMLNEAESLIELAQQRLLTARDLKAATILLTSSNDLLARIRSVDVTTARNALARDLANVREVPEVDVEALYLQLADLRSQVDGLSVISGTDNPQFAPPQPDEAVPADEAEQEGSSWMDSALSALSKYFVVTRDDVEVVPLLTEEQQFLLRQNIELQLISAQLALLDAEPEVYRKALAAAHDGVNRWLQGPEDTKTTVLDALNMLQEIQIVVSMPDISASLNAVRQIVPVASSPAAPAASEVVP